MNNIRNDINLREAVRHREQQLPPMPANLNEKVMGSLTPNSLTPNPNTVASGDSLPFMGPKAHSVLSLQTPVAPRRGETCGRGKIKKAFLLGGRFGWGLFAAAACMAGVIAVFLAPPKSTAEPHPSVSEEPAITSQLPIEYFQCEEGQSPMEAMLAHQQEIKKKGERLAAYIQKQVYPELDY